jgi:hypothetical protein
LKGLQPGGKCFGYRNVPIEDPTRTAKYGRAAVSGVRLAIDQVQAGVVRRVFEMYAKGKSLSVIAKTLNAEGVPAPQGTRRQAESGWFPSAIREMLRNERYRGFSFGIELGRNETQRQDKRLAVLVPKLSGCVPRFRNGGSLTKTYGPLCNDRSSWLTRDLVMLGVVGSAVLNEASDTSLAGF